jgi:hypothetical protein
LWIKEQAKKRPSSLIRSEAVLRVPERERTTISLAHGLDKNEKGQPWETGRWLFAL